MVLVYIVFCKILTYNQLKHNLIESGRTNFGMTTFISISDVLWGAAMQRDKRQGFSLKHQQERLAFELVVIGFMVLLIVLACLIECSVIVVPPILVHKHQETEELLLELFSVQASVSTLGIALISIITGLANETVAGVSVSRYITRIKPIILKHNRLIVANLIVILLNYFALAFILFNISVALFAISIIITIWLSQEVFVIFYGNETLKEEIRQYILDNYSESILAGLNQELSNSIEMGNSLVIKQSYELITDILKVEAKKKNYQATPITAQIIHIAADSFDKISYIHNPAKSNAHLLFI